MTWIRNALFRNYRHSLTCGGVKICLAGTFQWEIIKTGQNQCLRACFIKSWEDMRCHSQHISPSHLLVGLIITDQCICTRNILLDITIPALSTGHWTERYIITTPVRSCYSSAAGQRIQTSGADVVGNSISAVPRRQRKEIQARSNFMITMTCQRARFHKCWIIPVLRGPRITTRQRVTSQRRIRNSRTTRYLSEPIN